MENECQQISVVTVKQCLLFYLFLKLKRLNEEETPLRLCCIFRPSTLILPCPSVVFLHPF